ncbi:TPA: hypothetical protein OMU28_003033 [Klebsiella aerogenes]|nr:hypothetical protein [Klebsiella aerogenes]
MDQLIKEIRELHRAADNAFSYCAMNFDTRMDAINEWNRLLCPENVKLLLNLIDEQKEAIEHLELELSEKS